MFNTMDRPQIKYKSGYQYQTVADYKVRVSIFPEKEISTRFLCLKRNGLLTIKSGYAWDGPSGPTIHSKTFMRGSLVHDALYQLIRFGLIPNYYRLEADQELRRICLEDGMWSVRAWWVYQAVRTFGKAAADPRNKKEILTAPH